MKMSLLSIRIFLLIFLENFNESQKLLLIYQNTACPSLSKNGLIEIESHYVLGINFYYSIWG